MDCERNIKDRENEQAEKEREERYFNAAVDFMTRMIRKYGAEIMKEQQERTK